MSNAVQIAESQGRLERSTGQELRYAITRQRPEPLNLGSAGVKVRT